MAATLLPAAQPRQGRKFQTSSLRLACSARRADCAVGVVSRELCIALFSVKKFCRIVTADMQFQRSLAANAHGARAEQEEGGATAPRRCTATRTITPSRSPARRSKNAGPAARLYDLDQMGGTLNGATMRRCSLEHPIIGKKWSR